MGPGELAGLRWLPGPADIIITNMHACSSPSPTDVGTRKAMCSRDGSLVTFEECDAPWSQMVVALADGDSMEKAFGTMMTDASAALVPATPVRLANGHG